MFLSCRIIPFRASIFRLDFYVSKYAALFLFIVFGTLIFTVMSTVYTPEQAAEECLHTSIIQILFSRPRGKTDAKKVCFRKIELKGKPYYQFETVKNNQAFQKNIAPEAMCDQLSALFVQFRTVECRGLNEQLFFLQNNKGVIALTKRVSIAASSDKTGGHDRTKAYLIPEGKPLVFLIEQGVMHTSGAVIKKKYHKFRQINKFLEFIADTEPFIRQTTEQSGKPFSIIDFGCGKAYLSFALYHYLHEQQGLPVQIHGLDLKTDVVARCSALAEKCRYTGLSFTQGDIAGYPIPAGTGMMVCLHACDTATDLAIAQAIRQNVPVIFAVPCCQHELYAQLKARKGTFKAEQHLLAPFMEHGIVTERFASLLTDTVRALFLQIHGYTVQIMEFIETEHTPKNILIHAVRNEHMPAQDSLLRKEALKKYRTIKESFSIKPLLEELLGMQ